MAQPRRTGRRPAATIAAGAAMACLLGWAAPAMAADAAFTSAGEIALDSNAGPQAIATGDLNSDGRQDLAIVDFNGNRLYLRLGNGDGTFKDAGKVGGLTRPQDVAVGDFDADGTEDIAVAAGVAATKAIAVLRGVGDGSFPFMAPVDVTAFASSLAVGDFNGDGKEDLADTTYMHVNVRLGNGNTTFAGGVDVPFSPSPSSVTTGDFDGNGIEDLAVFLTSPSRVGILPGKGNGTFEPVKSASLPNVAERIAAADFNADGREDVAAAIRPEDKISVRLGNGDGTLRDDSPDVPVGDEPFGIAAGDFDGDSRQDLAASNIRDDSVSVRLGNGDGSFRDGGEIAVGDVPVGIAAGDFNADGKADLAVVNYAGATVSIRLGSATAPLAGNLLVNGGFEEGLAARLPTQSPAIPGWTSTGGMTFVRYGAVPHLGFPSQLDAPPYATGGLNFLWGGDSTGLAGVTTATQTVDVSGAAEPIDGARATANLSAFLGGAQTYPDRMSATADFLNAAGASLGAFQIGPVTNTDRGNVTTLLRRASSAPVPPGTRRIRVTLTSTDNDTVSSAMADNVKLTLDVAAPAGGSSSSQQPGSPRRAFGARTKVTIGLAASRIGARGPVAVRLANANAFAVTGTLAGTTKIAGRRGAVKLAARRLTIAAGSRKTVKLTLSRALRRELVRTRKLVLRLAVVVRDPAGNRRTVRRQVAPRLKAPARRA